MFIIKKGELIIWMSFLVSILFLIACSKNTGPDNLEGSEKSRG